MCSSTLSELPFGLTCSAVGVQVERRRGQLLGIERHLLALRRVLRIEEVADGQAGQAVLEMDDQRLARKDLQRRRGIEIVARHLPVRRRAADHLIAEEQEVLDRRGDRVEAGLALMRGERHLEHAVLARQHDRLAELGPDRGIEGRFGVLRRGRGPGGQDPNRKGDKDAHDQWPQDSVHGPILLE